MQLQNRQFSVSIAMYLWFFIFLFIPFVNSHQIDNQHWIKLCATRGIQIIYVAPTILDDNLTSASVDHGAQDDCECLVDPTTYHAKIQLILYPALITATVFAQPSESVLIRKYSKSPRAPPYFS